MAAHCAHAPLLVVRAMKRSGLRQRKRLKQNTMTTKLSSAFRRELEINGEKYTLTVSPEGFKLVVKGRRKGIELSWQSLVSGEAALATALNATLVASRTASSSARNHTKH